MNIRFLEEDRWSVKEEEKEVSFNEFSDELDSGYGCPEILIEMLKKRTGNLFVHKKKTCPRFSLESNPRKTGPFIPFGITLITYKDRCERIVGQKKIWLDFKRNPTHVIYVTFCIITGNVNNVHVFPLL